MPSADTAKASPTRACPYCECRKRTVLYDKLTDVTFFSTRAQVTMFSCADCASGYLDPLPSDAVLAEAYSAYYTHNEEHRQGRRFMSPSGGLKSAVSNGFKRARFAGSTAGGDRIAQFVTRLMPGKTDVIEQKMRFLPGTPGLLMDFGCGAGEFLELAGEVGWVGHGLDFDADAVEVVRRKGLAADVGGVDALAERPERYDAVTISHVIEHVPDPAALVTASFAALKPGGFLYIETPSMDALGREIWGRSWRGLEAPRHLSIATRDALRGLVERHGFSNLRFHRLSAKLRTRYFRSLYSTSAVIQAGGDPEAPGSYAMNEPPPRHRLASAMMPSRMEFLMLTAEKPGR